MLTDKIKEKTKTSHQALEKLLVSHIKSITTPEDYLKILLLFYRFFTPLERDLLISIEKFIPDISQRRKAEAIIEDLEFFGSSVPLSPASSPLLSIENPIQALGVMYVMEGSTMGGPIISKMISQRLKLPASTGFKFFNGYGEATNRMWEKFTGFINCIKWTEEEEDEIVDAAYRTFVHFKQFILMEIEH